MKKKLQNIIFESIKNLYPEVDLKVEEIVLTHPHQEQFGDYTTNVAMKLAARVKKSLLEVAEELKKQIQGSIETIEPAAKDEPIKMLEKIEVARPGFLNIFLAKDYFQQKVTQINEQQGSYGNSTIGQGIKVEDEFISANPTGPLHLGNGRGGFIGDALGNVMKKASYEVTKEYYVNDFGEQVVKLGHSVLEDDQAEYRGEYIGEIQKQLAGDEKDPKAVGQAGAKIVMDQFFKKTVQEKLGIQFDVWFSEKSLYDEGLVDEAINILKEKGHTFEKEGALWFSSTKFGDDKDRVLIKSDGNKTYFASDCGYLLSRMKRGFQIMIEIWGADHHGYMKRFEVAARALGYEGKIDFIIMQLVRLVKDGQEFRMSKRKGNVIYIDDLIEMVGTDVARFLFLMYSPDAHMNFDLDVAQEKSEKNPVFYVQYAHARICSILGKSEILNLKSKNLASQLNLLMHEKELALIRHLNKFPELIEEVAGNYEVHRLPYYAIELADRFHSFYHDCKVIDEANLDLSASRLELVKAAKIVLAETLRLIGVGAPEKM